ncbi:MAG TPA: hypothetical protein VMF90_24255 [Rhizobiaceae bacterium]|nr:hypothetical protein [Rhizobiaceae bacterium]
MSKERAEMSATLQRMLEKEIGVRKEKRGLVARLIGRQEGTSPAATESRRSGNLTIAALGITLGLICALFPWYIFFNQDKFGIRPLKFGGQSEISGPITLGDQPQRVGAPMQVDEIPIMKLDLFATGTLPDLGDDRDAELPGVEQQPFPVEEPEFKLIHVANGRAMIEDDTGLFVVQRGSTLPDNSSVAAIEVRDGKWVIVTSKDRVITIE